MKIYSFYTISDSPSLCLESNDYNVFVISLSQLIKASLFIIKSGVTISSTNYRHFWLLTLNKLVIKEKKKQVPNSKKLMYYSYKKEKKCDYKSQRGWIDNLWRQPRKVKKNVLATTEKREVKFLNLSKFKNLERLDN